MKTVELFSQQWHHNNSRTEGVLFDIKRNCIQNIKVLPAIPCFTSKPTNLNEAKTHFCSTREKKEIFSEKKTFSVHLI